MKQIKLALILLVLSTSAYADCYTTIVGTSEYVYCDGVLTMICTEVGDRKYCRNI